MPPVRARLPRSRTGRVPQWVIDESLGLQGTDTSFRQWSPSYDGPRHRNRSRSRTFSVLMAALVLLGVAVGVTELGIRPEATDDSAGPLPGPVRTGGSSYAFLHTDPVTGEPSGYDPCTPVDVVIRLAGAPAGGQAMIEEALDSVAAVSGLAFRVVGATDRAPAAALTPQTHGAEPVLIAWSDEHESPALAGDVAGYAGSVPAPGPLGGRAYLRTGQVVLDTVDLAPYSATPEGRAAVVGVITHEVGHLVGLDHVEDTAELMHPQNQPGTTRMGPGDLTGLRLLGSIPCETGSR